MRAEAGKGTCTCHCPESWVVEKPVGMARGLGINWVVAVAVDVVVDVPVAVPVDVWVAVEVPVAVPVVV